MSSMAYNSAAGFSGMLKDGARHLSNSSDNQGATVTIRNLEACIQLCKMVSSSYGPNGRCKLLINHLGKMNVTSDCAAILKEIDIEHPAAQLLAQAVNKQEETCGDNTNYVLTLAGELCYQTIELIQKMGGTMGTAGGGGTSSVLNDILSGYTIALNKIQTELLIQSAIPVATATSSEDTTTTTTTDAVKESTFVKVLKPVLMTKQYGSQDILAPLVAKACLNTMKNTKSTKFNPGSIRAVKILGSSIHKSELIHGFVAQRGLEVTPNRNKDDEGAALNDNSLQNAKIAVFACGIEASTTEAKGTVTMKNAQDLKSYNLSEEKKMDDIIGSIHASGCNFVVSGGNVSDMAIHYLIKYNIGCLKIGSKWELRRMCQATNSVALVRLGAPTVDEMGFAANITYNKMIGSKKVTIFSQQTTTKDDDDTTKTTAFADSSSISTIILRATTTSVLNDLERAVEDGVRTIEMYTKHSSNPKGAAAVYGGGCIEMSMAIALHEHANTVPGLEQYSIRAFAKSLEIVPRILAQNAGLEPLKVISNLQQVHYNHYHDNTSSSTSSSGEICEMGVDIDNTDGTNTGITSMKKQEIIDLLITKHSAIRLALDATMTILKIDQIIMSKPSGGPAVPQ